MKPILQFSLLLLVASLAACASTPDRNPLDYHSERKSTAPELDAPPDLTQLSRDSFYPAPAGGVTANHYRTEAAIAPSAPTAIAEVGDVHIEHDGAQRWLVVEHPTPQLWQQVSAFWLDNGFLLALDQPATGIMETDWATSHANLPQDIIRSTVGKVVDSDYDTSALNRFRTRLEHTANGATEIYVSHRGLIESHNAASPDHADWQATPTDSEIEAEYLHRLMVKLGSSEAPPTVAGVTVVPSQTARLSTHEGQPTMQLNVDFDRAWRRVGLALDRTGFTVEDRDRKAGLYFVRYVTPNPDKKEPGIFTKLVNFAKDTPVAKPLQFRISVKSQGDASTVSVLNEAGAPDSSEDARRIIKVIADDVG